MIKSFLKKKRSKGKEEGPATGGGSIQERIDALREKPGGPASNGDAVNGGSAANGSGTPEEKAFLKKFTEEIVKRPPRPAQSLPESLAESSREMREALARREREAKEAQPTPRPAPATPEPRPIQAASTSPTPLPRVMPSAPSAATPLPRFGPSTPPPTPTPLPRVASSVPLSATPFPRVSQSAPSSATPLPKASQPSATVAGALPPEGSILHLSSGENLVFCLDVPNKKYQLVAVLDRDGSVHAEGVYLDAYEYRVIGTLPLEHLQRIRDDRRWRRDLIVYHLDRFEDAKLIPPERGGESASEPTLEPKAPARRANNDRSPRFEGNGTPSNESDETEESDEPDETEEADESDESDEREGPESSEEEEGDIRGASHFGRPVSLRSELVRGRRFSIKFGARTWEAVYWGDDEQGSVVAHSTNGQWSLMHLDLSRFRDSFVLKEEISDKERRELEKSLLRSSRH